MLDARFSDAEVATFIDWYGKIPTWTEWSRHEGEHGEDVIEIKVGGRRPHALKLARSARFGYMVTGFDGWALTVCDDFSELLSILSRYRPTAAEQADRVALSLAG